MSTLKLGGHVVYVDEYSVRRDALLTAIHGNPELTPAVNLVIVNLEENQTDNYGQKIERRSSCVHQSSQGAAGNYWVRS